MKRIIEIVRKLSTNIRSKYFSNFWNIAHDHQIMSFDLGMMRKFNFSPIKIVVHIIFYILFLVAPGYIYCMRNSPGLVNSSTAIIEVILVQIVIVKIIICCIHKESMSKLFLSLQCAWSKSLIDNIPEWNNEHHKLQTYTTIYGRIMIYFTRIGISFYCLFPIILSILTKFDPTERNDLALLYKSDIGLYKNVSSFFYDIRSNFYVYILYLIIFVPMTYRLGIWFQVHDIMTVNTFLYIGAYFKFVDFKFKKLNEELAELDEQELRLNEEQIISRLKNIVDLHNEAIDFVKEFEKIVSVIMLFNYLCSTFAFGFTGFILTVIENDSSFMIRMILALLWQIGQTFIPSYAGERVIENHRLIGVQAYNLKWYNKSPVVAKMLQMIILRSQKTVGITAGKFYFVSLQSFGSIMEAGASYCTMVRSLYSR